MTSRSPDRDHEAARARAPRPDPVLAILCVLLVTTLGAFAAGWMDYPAGLLVLLALAVSRAVDLRRRAGTRR